MKKFLQHFTHKNEKILRRELMLAHITIVLLSLALITTLIVANMVADVFNTTMVVIISILLTVVVLLSASIAGYISFYNKK